MLFFISARVFICRSVLTYGAVKKIHGEIFPTVELEAEIVRQGLKFVIPKRGV